eukprot:TRINITY_DN1094_c0_g1_i1.p1 TRINITY_DN1094_c0_g1~~TRINITY_DN1094_c0_g1_i1.p1  ORF type:complete len:143 (-),score=19.18 TRINITY_DN1094_c0_g1_i1:11-439(-)
MVVLPGIFMNDEFRTKAHKKGGHSPVWEESHTFKIKNTKPDTKVKIALYDHATFKEEYIGKAEIFLAELLEHAGQKHYYELLEKRPDHRVAGYVGILVEWDNHEHKEHHKEESLTHIEHPKEEIGRAVQQECRDRSRMPSSA